MRYIQVFVVIGLLASATNGFASNPWDYCAEMQDQLQQQADIVFNAAKSRLDPETKAETSRLAKKVRLEKQPKFARLEANSKLFPDFINILFRDYELLRQLPWSQFRKHFLNSGKPSPFRNEFCLEIYLSSLIQLEQLSIVKDGASGTYQITAKSKLEAAYNMYTSSIEQSPTNPYNKREAEQELTDTRNVKKAGGPQKISP